MQISKTKKILAFLGLFVIFLVYDMINVANYRKPNFFEIFGLSRYSTEQEVQLQKAYWQDKMELGEFSPPWQDSFEDMFNMVADPDLRELYDKHEFYLTAENLSQSIPMTAKYIQAFSQVGKYTPFFFMTFFLLGKHQLFAKRVIMSSLFITLYVAIFMKMPKEEGMNKRDNQVIELIESIPFLSHLTYFEVGEILRLMYANVFNLCLALSRLIDIHPIDEKFNAIKMLGKDISNTLLICEILDPQRHKKAEEQRKLEEEKQQEALPSIGESQKEEEQKLTTENQEKKADDIQNSNEEQKFDVEKSKDDQIVNCSEIQVNQSDDRGNQTLQSILTEIQPSPVSASIKPQNDEERKEEILQAGQFVLHAKQEMLFELMKERHEQEKVEAAKGSSKFKTWAKRILIIVIIGGYFYSKQNQPKHSADMNRAQPNFGAPTGGYQYGGNPTGKYGKTAKMPKTAKKKAQSQSDPQNEQKGRRPENQKEQARKEEPKEEILDVDELTGRNAHDPDD